MSKAITNGSRVIQKGIAEHKALVGTAMKLGWNPTTGKVSILVSWDDNNQQWEDPKTLEVVSW